MKCLQFLITRVEKLLSVLKIQGQWFHTAVIWHSNAIWDHKSFSTKITDWILTLHKTNKMLSYYKFVYPISFARMDDNVLTIHLRKLFISHPLQSLYCPLPCTSHIDVTDVYKQFSAHRISLHAIHLVNNECSYISFEAS